MNKQEFMGRLSHALSNMPEEEKRDILYDYEEHFSVAMEKGKTEEEAADELGDPEDIVKYYRANAAINRAEANKSVRHITSAVFSVIGLGLVNLIFVLGPYLGIVGVLIGFFAAAIALSLSGVVGMLAAVLAPLFPEFIFMPVNQGAVIFVMLGLACLGLLMFIGCCYLARGLYTVTLRYLKFNLRIIQK